MTLNLRLKGKEDGCVSMQKESPPVVALTIHILFIFLA